MDKKITSFEELNCWKACRDVRIFVMGLIKHFPSEEKYALTDGIKRASRSITENIAEGFGRYHFQENVQFCRHARGSLHEIIDQLITAKDEHYIAPEKYKEGRELIKKALSLLNEYINYLLKAKITYQNNKENMINEDASEYSSYNI